MPAQRTFEQRRDLSVPADRAWAALARIEAASHDATAAWEDARISVTVEDDAGQAGYDTIEDAYENSIGSRHKIKHIVFHCRSSPRHIYAIIHLEQTLFRSHVVVTSSSEVEARGIADVLAAEAAAAEPNDPIRTRSQNAWAAQVVGPPTAEVHSGVSAAQIAEPSTSEPRKWWRAVSIEVAGGIIAALVVIALTYLFAR